MKNLLWGFLIVTTIGCAKEEAANLIDTEQEITSCANHDFLGTWYNSASTTDVLEVGADCVITRLYCGHIMEMTPIGQTPEISDITLLDATVSNPGCWSMHTVEYVCEFNLDPNSGDERLHIDCGIDGVFEFQRWQ